LRGVIYLWQNDFCSRDNLLDKQWTNSSSARRRRWERCWKLHRSGIFFVQRPVYFGSH
jgi:hypothetical protein